MHVDIYVGAEQKHFSLPMRLLSQRSSFFKSYFSRAVDPCRLDLALAQPATFAIVAQWMYQGRLPLLHINASRRPSLGGIRDVVALYHMANRFCLTKLQDEILANMVENYLCLREEESIDPEEVFAIYRGTDDGSPLRVFAADALAYSFIHKNQDAAGHLQTLFIEFPDSATEFVEALRAIHIDGEDFLATRLFHARYLH